MGVSLPIAHQSKGDVKNVSKSSRNRKLRLCHLIREWLKSQNAPIPQGGYASLAKDFLAHENCPKEILEDHRLQINRTNTLYRYLRDGKYAPKPEKPVKQKPASKKNLSLKYRTPSGDNLYDSDEWKQLRYRVLVKYGRRCMCCGATPADGKKMHVDHIKSRSKYPHLALVFENLQVLCEDCNIGKGNTDEIDYRPAEVTD